jgi:hypothetical protein
VDVLDMLPLVLPVLLAFTVSPQNQPPATEVQQHVPST